MDFEPMLALSTDVATLGTYASNPHWYMEQKLDGMRIVIEVNDGKVRGYNRSGEYVTLDRRLTEPFTDFEGLWYFDCEMLGTLWLFDLPRALDVISFDTPYRDRRTALEAVYKASWGDDHPHVKLLDTARTAQQKRALIKWVVANNGEGLMLKLRTGKYTPQQGRRKRSPDVLKAKFTTSVECIINEVGREGKASCGLDLYHHGVRRDVASCKMDEMNLRRAKVDDVVEVRYLYASPDLRLVQPVFLRFRDDKAPDECTTDQLKVTNKTVRRKAHR